MDDRNERIDNLIIRSLQRRTTPAEEAQLRSWRESRWENEEKYRSLTELWSVVGAAASVRDVGVPPAAEFIIARADADPAGARRKRSPVATVSAGATQRTRRRAKKWPRRVVIGALAASLAALSFGLGIVSHLLVRQTESLAYQEVITGADESTTVTFSDNTAVRLGPNGKLRLVEDGDNPVVWLEGRAFFGVVPNASRTFTVRTTYGDAVALGTRFEVRTEEEELRVLVVQGNVRVSASDSSVDLGAGVMSRNVVGAPPSTSHVEDVDAQLDWIGQVLMFRVTPLSRVTSEIEHRYGVAVDLEDDSLSSLTVTATFTDQPAESVIFVICEIVGARCSIRDGRFQIGSSGPGTVPSNTRPSAAPPARSP